MSETIMVLADIHGLAGRRSELEDVLASLAAASRQEHGCQSFRVLAAEEAADFVVLSRWDEEGALRAHYATAHYRRYRAAIGPLLAHPSNVTVLQVRQALHALDPNPPDPSKLG